MVYRASNGYHFRHVSSHNYLILHVKMRKKAPQNTPLGSHTHVLGKGLFDPSPTEDSHVNIVWYDVAVRKRAIQEFSAADIDTFP